MIARSPHNPSMRAAIMWRRLQLFRNRGCAAMVKRTTSGCVQFFSAHCFRKPCYSEDGGPQPIILALIPIPKEYVTITTANWQSHNFRSWHLSDMPTDTENVCSLG